MARTTVAYSAYCKSPVSALNTVVTAPPAMSADRMMLNHFAYH